MPERIRMLPTTMTAIDITSPGGPGVLRPGERAVPKPGAGQVLIKVAYAGVNRHDCGQRQRGHAPAGATDGTRAGKRDTPEKVNYEYPTI
jgi:NADPH:quinone reductase-like Zn-dependent oxidoreductase